MSWKGINGLFKTFGGIDWTWKKVVVIGLLGLFGHGGYMIYSVPSMLELKKEKKEAEKLNKEHKVLVDSLEILIPEFRQSQIRQDKQIREALDIGEYAHENLTNVVEIINGKINDVDERDSEKGLVLSEELDIIDTCGSKLFMTNPGNLYDIVDGHFIGVIKDHHRKKFYYMQEGKRIYCD